MPYTGNDPDLVDLQNQITDNLNAQNTSLNSIKTQIKQVILTLEGELNTVKQAFQLLKDYVTSKVPS